MLVAGKKCWAGFVKKMATQESALGGGRFLPLVQSSLKTAPQLATTRAFQAGTTQSPLGMVPGTTHIHPTHLAGVKGWVESQILWCNVHNVWVGAQIAKLAALQLMQLVGVRSRQEARSTRRLGPTPSRFSPHNVECKKGEG
jgi:hypothetical protein